MIRQEPTRTHPCPQKRRFLCVYLPSWSTDLAARRFRIQNAPSPELLALTQKESNHVIIKRVTPKAYASGVREGMPLTLGHAILPQLQTTPFMPEEDCRALFGLAAWAQKFSPLVGIDPELLETIKKKTLLDITRQMCGLVIDLTGTARLHKSEKHLLGELRSAFKANGYYARFAIADTVAVAWAFSRFTKQPLTVIASEGSAFEMLSELPIGALRIASESLQILKDVGITSIAQLVKIPRRELAQQVGFGVLKRLDQAQGAVPEQITYLQQKKQALIKKTFPVPLESKVTIQESVRRLIEKLSLVLAENQLTATRFIIHFHPLGSNLQQNFLTKELSLSSGCTSTQQLNHVINPFVESIHICSGIETITVLAPTPIALKPAQTTLPSFPYQGSDLCHEDLELLLNQCAARIGPQNIQRLMLTPEYLIEDSFHFKPITSSSPGLPNIRKNQHAFLPRDTPAKLINPPQQIKVISLLPDYTPAHIQWRGQRHKIAFSAGPERLTRHWHKQHIVAEIGGRDYFKVQDINGQWFWIFREHQSQHWFIHGLWI